MSVAKVKLWGRQIGAVSWDKNLEIANFEYNPDFVASNIEISPFMMPLKRQIYSFRALPKETFYGLPGMLADSLPDNFGNKLINTWLVNKGETIDSFNPVDRLCYVGKRGMGALEFEPSNSTYNISEQINIDELVKISNDILNDKYKIKGSFSNDYREKTLQNILSVGTSAGGARAKAIIAWNPKTNEVRSGQINQNSNFSYWILKFDGISESNQLSSTKRYGLIEYAYYLMATSAGILMSESRLLKENGRYHFLTKRFDRKENGEKLHMQSFAALEHLDYKQAGVYSYEQVFMSIKKLNLNMETLEEQFRRMVFNILARNQDDHVKNIAFLMNKSGEWSLSPAFDITYNYNPNGVWTGVHQMSLNGKRDNFNMSDFINCGKRFSFKRGAVIEIIQQVSEALSNWKNFASVAGIAPDIVDAISKHHKKIL